MWRTLHTSFFWGLCGLFLLGLSSCSKDDEGENKDPFYGDALTSASVDMLEGTWSIYEVSFEGQKAAVPQNDQNCSRDFFIYGKKAIIPTISFKITMNAFLRSAMVDGNSTTASLP